MKILITSPVSHDGKPVKAGTTLDLPNEQAQALIDAGVAEQAGKKKAEAAAGDGDGAAGDTGAKE